MLYLFPVWHLIPVVAMDFHSAGDASYLVFRGLPTNRIQVSNIVKTAEAAFSDIESTSEEAMKIFCIHHQQQSIEAICGCTIAVKV